MSDGVFLEVVQVIGVHGFLGWTNFAYLQYFFVVLEAVAVAKPESLRKGTTFLDVPGGLSCVL